MLIDTDKYENHDMIRVAKALLIEDAPLLLAEVKRWHKVYQHIHHLYSSNQKTMSLHELMELIDEVVIE